MFLRYPFEEQAYFRRPEFFLFRGEKHEMIQEWYLRQSRCPQLNVFLDTVENVKSNNDSYLIWWMARYFRLLSTSSKYPIMHIDREYPFQSLELFAIAEYNFQLPNKAYISVVSPTSEGNQYLHKSGMIYIHTWAHWSMERAIKVVLLQSDHNLFWELHRFTMDKRLHGIEIQLENAMYIA